MANKNSIATLVLILLLVVLVVFFGVCVVKLGLSLFSKNVQKISESNSSTGSTGDDDYEAQVAAQIAKLTDDKSKLLDDIKTQTNKLDEITSQFQQAQSKLNDELKHEQLQAQSSNDAFNVIQTTMATMDANSQPTNSEMMVQKMFLDWQKKLQNIVWFTPDQYQNQTKLDSAYAALKEALDQNNDVRQKTILSAGSAVTDTQKHLANMLELMSHMKLDQEYNYHTLNILITTSAQLTKTSMDNQAAQQIKLKENQEKLAAIKAANDAKRAAALAQLQKSIDDTKSSLASVNGKNSQIQSEINNGRSLLVHYQNNYDNMYGKKDAQGRIIVNDYDNYIKQYVSNVDNRMVLAHLKDGQWDNGQRFMLTTVNYATNYPEVYFLAFVPEYPYLKMLKWSSVQKDIEKASWYINNNNLLLANWQKYGDYMIQFRGWGANLVFTTEYNDFHDMYFDNLNYDKLHALTYHKDDGRPFLPCTDANNPILMCYNGESMPIDSNQWIAVNPNDMMSLTIERKGWNSYL